MNKPSLDLPRLACPADLAEYRDRAVKDRGLCRARILVCMTGCRALGALELRTAFQEKLAAAGMDKEVSVVDTGCHGQCSRAPLIVIEPWNYVYGRVHPEDVDEIIEQTLRDGVPVERLCVRTGGVPTAVFDEVGFYNHQRREVLAQCGRIDPTKIDDAIAHDGYAAVAKSLTEMTPDEVISEVKNAGLRGRGGAGFPTGTKWGFCRQSPGHEKYLICNADEGDPGAFMDRALLEGTPHQVIEGMIVAAYAIGASHGFIYVRAEYPIAVDHVETAIRHARSMGLLGNDILGSGFSFDIEVRMGAGAFVCGEETALIASLEGRRGMPRPRPPFPAVSGYLGKPTNINNVETLANVPLIILKGSEWYRSIGTEGSKGTKIFALAGKVNNTGLVEVPMGTTLRQIVFDIGGGIPGNRKFKAVQMGGPSGGCVPAPFLDLPIDYESVQQVGAIMGSGGLVVMDETTCMVDVARYFLDFVQKESCGKCVPCRVGTRHMLDILTRICDGKGQPGDIERLEQLAAIVKQGSLCGLGQTAPNPVLSTIRYFRHEYEEHIYEKRCRASVCEAMIESPCSHACPAGINVPQYVAMLAEDKVDDAVNMIRRRNPFVSVCGRVCDAPCERRCRRADVDESIAIRALKRYAADNSSDFAAPLVPPATGTADIAIVGAGPAGLSCAYFLALMGRRSVVFEALPIAGGMLAVGIPEYRLPKHSLQADIDFILGHGVELRTGVRIDGIEQLQAEGYKAIFIGAGAHTGRQLGIEGEDLDGVLDSLVMLRAHALDEPVDIGRRVAVIGGGNAAIDAARTALRIGAETVEILYRRTREEMPAYEEEIEAALEEGIGLTELVAPTRVVGRNGKVIGVEMVRMRLGDADESGRRRPVPIDGTEFVVDCDTVVPAIGQKASVETVRDAVVLTPWGTVKTDTVTCATSTVGVFAGGDCVTGGSTVVEAIGAGQKAAVAIDRMLGGTGILPSNSGMSMYRASEEDLEKIQPRAKEPVLPVDERLAGFAEVVGGLRAEAACAEAGRCLRCDLERAASGADRGE